MLRPTSKPCAQRLHPDHYIDFAQDEDDGDVDPNPYEEWRRIPNLCFYRPPIRRSRDSSNVRPTGFLVPPKMTNYPDTEEADVLGDYDVWFLPISSRSLLPPGPAPNPLDPNGNGISVISRIRMFIPGDEFVERIVPDEEGKAHFEWEVVRLSTAKTVCAGSFCVLPSPF